MKGYKIMTKEKYLVEFSDSKKDALILKNGLFLFSP